MVTETLHSGVVEMKNILEESMRKFGATETSLTFELANGDVLFVQLRKHRLTEADPFDDDENFPDSSRSPLT